MARELPCVASPVHVGFLEVTVLHLNKVEVLELVFLIAAFFAVVKMENSQDSKLMAS